MKKFVTFVFLCGTLLAMAVIVHAQSTIKQISRIEKIKVFLNSTSVEIMDKYTEEGISVYKVYDILNDKYYKLAVDKDETINLYNIVKRGESNKLDDSLKKRMDAANTDDKMEIIVELAFDYTELSNELYRQEQKYYSNQKISVATETEKKSQLKNLKREYIKNKMVA